MDTCTRSMADGKRRFPPRRPSFRCSRSVIAKSRPSDRRALRSKYIYTTYNIVDLMKKRSATEDVDPRILDRLRAYTALDNPIRLRAFRHIHDSPGLPFHEIARAIRIES